MRCSPFVFCSLVFALGVGALGCSVAVTVKPQTKYIGDTAITKTATRAFAATDVIEIENGNGDVVVTGVSGLDKITVSTKVFAFAETKTDGDAAIADLAGTIALEESAGKFYIHCNKATSSHGSAATGTTGCEGFTVQVPAGSVAAPLSLKATAHNGDITANGIVGAAVVHTDNGDAVASITPTPGAVIEVSTGNADATLSLPANFTADTVTLTALGAAPKVVNTDFPDVSDAAGVHRKSGGAKSITVKTENGTVTLKKQ